MPFFAAMWLKNGTQVSATEVTFDPNKNNGWAETQIVCIPADQTQAGSRTLKQAQDALENAAGRVGGWELGVVGVAGLTAILLL
jgi:hypothetical protein